MVAAASQGLGFAIAKVLASEGAQVSIAARKQETISAAAGRIGGGASNVIRLREPGSAPTSEQTIQIDAAAQGLSTARSSAMSRCVFLRRRPGPAAWREIHMNAALDYFLKYLFPRDTARARRHLREFLDSPVMALEYERMEDAAAALEAL